MSDFVLGVSRLDKYGSPPGPVPVSYGQTLKIATEADRKLEIAVAALEQICDADYRGNRSSESTIAWRALQKMGLRK